MAMQKMVVPFNIKSVDEDAEFLIFKGYASTFNNEDLGGDKIMPGAFSKSLKSLKNLPALWQHDHSMPVGVFTHLQEDKKGLYVEGKLPKADTFVSGRLIPQMQIGSINKMSIGYTVNKEGATYSNNVRELHNLKLWEISLVTIPMNQEANITSIKSAVPYQDLPLSTRDRPWDSGLAMQRIRLHTDSDDSPGTNYKKAFLWFDENDKDSFMSYKLPIADVVDGYMMVVPRAIFSAAAALRGARGGVDIPEDDRAGVVENVNRYYKKMDLESPFQGKTFRIDDITVLDEHMLEDLFFSGVKVSKKLAKTVVAYIKSAIERDASGADQRDADLDEVKKLLQNTVNNVNKEI